MRARLRTVLFDLDGTLADTAPDMAQALNLLLKEKDYQPLPFDTIRPWVSHGGLALVRLGFGEERGDVELENLRQRFLEIYAENLCRETHLFPGIPQLLAMLSKNGFNWGVVTNKPRYLTEPLVAQLTIQPPPACIVSGDTTTNRKPHPEPMLLACKQAGSDPHECLYVGDAERDIHAGKQAGMKTLVALFGYITDSEDPETWGADGMIRAPMEVFDWLKQHA
ncbi:MAG: HAD-IA family hydrolase [Gammaproteobacteria bacterium]|nr:HAD-IA family hydrolase [Gammaproteobacteria bacterium]